MMFESLTSNMTGATNEAGTAYPSAAQPFVTVAYVARVAQFLFFCVMFCG